jgi:hypothetical protein
LLSATDLLVLSIYPCLTSIHIGRTNGVDNTFDCVRIMTYPFDCNIGFGTLLDIYRRIRQDLEPLFPPIIPVPQCLSRYTIGHLLTLQRRKAFKSLLNSNAGGYLTN